MSLQWRTCYRNRRKFVQCVYWPRTSGSLQTTSGVVRAAVDTFGHLDILVNNAAFLIRREALTGTVDEWDTMVTVNLKADFSCTKGGGPHGHRTSWTNH